MRAPHVGRNKRPDVLTKVTAPCDNNVLHTLRNHVHRLSIGPVVGKRVWYVVNLVLTALAELFCH